MSISWEYQVRRLLAAAGVVSPYAEPFPSYVVLEPLRKLDCDLQEIVVAKAPLMADAFRETRPDTRDLVSRLAVLATSARELMVENLGLKNDRIEAEAELERVKALHADWEKNKERLGWVDVALGRREGETLLDAVKRAKTRSRSASRTCPTRPSSAR